MKHPGDDHPFGPPMTPEERDYTDGLESTIAKLRRENAALRRHAVTLKAVLTRLGYSPQLIRNMAKRERAAMRRAKRGENATTNDPEPGDA